MEGYGHNTICGVECFLDTIAMVNIDVDVQHTLMDTASESRLSVI